MPSTLELCEKHWGTKDIYNILNLTKESSASDIKKAYYRLSLLVHPDRVNSDEKEVATQKFQVLSKLYTILTDKNKRALYDEQGIIYDDNDCDLNLTGWLDIWKSIFKPITEEDIDKFQKEYVGSDLEKQDLKKAYLAGKGCINYMMDTVPFMSVEDEPRFQEIIKEWIQSGDVPDYKQFTDEHQAKRSRRHRKYAKESLEAKEIKKNLEAKSKKTTSDCQSLEQLILQRQTNREQNFNSLIDKLSEKYGNSSDAVDESDEYVLPETKRKRSTTTKKATTSRKKPATKK